MRRLLLEHHRLLLLEHVALAKKTSITSTEPVDNGVFTLEVLAHAGNGARQVPDRTASSHFFSSSSSFRWSPWRLKGAARAPWKRQRRGGLVASEKHRSACA
jgi:hypothetical protein